MCLHIRYTPHPGANKDSSWCACLSSIPPIRLLLQGLVTNTWGYPENTQRLQISRCFTPLCIRQSQPQTSIQHVPWWDEALDHGLSILVSWVFHCGHHHPAALPTQTSLFCLCLLGGSHNRLLLVSSRAAACCQNLVGVLPGNSAIVVRRVMCNIKKLETSRVSPHIYHIKDADHLNMAILGWILSHRIREPENCVLVPKEHEFWIQTPRVQENQQKPCELRGFSSSWKV